MTSILFPLNLLTGNESERPYILDGLATDYIMHKTVRQEAKPGCLWLLTRKGSGQLFAAGQRTTVSQGQGLWINPGQTYELTANPEGWTVDWLALSGSGLDCLMQTNPELSQPTVFHLADDAAMHDYFIAILEQGPDYSRSAYDRYSMEAYSCVLQILQQIRTDTGSGRGNREQRLKPVLDYITEHFRESITLDVLSQVMGVTPQHLCTVFRKLMGLRIFEYINQIRIQASKADLISVPDKSVKAVANDCGFDDVSYFCSIFKRFEKVTPGDFRKLYHV
ncbi:MAG: AraC family transcriptional regulator [Eubacteriales bacterium]|nr:AraC family transcriptional regulator [Eubacteriales bacterium]